MSKNWKNLLISLAIGTVAVIGFIAVIAVVHSSELGQGIVSFIVLVIIVTGIVHMMRSSY